MVGRQNCEEKNNASLDPTAYGSRRVGPYFHGWYQRGPLLQANSHVYVEVAGLIWSYPIKEVNRYIERIVDAGFEDRIVFGTDQFMWPKLMAHSIGLSRTPTA